MLSFSVMSSLMLGSALNCCSLVLSFIIIGLPLMHLIWYIIGKRRRCRLVKWVDKTSFDRLNKLFMISTGEQNHETLLTNQNLLALVRDSELYVVPTLPRFVPRMLILDLHFYVEARATDTKARQDWLEKREKKRQEGTLR